MPRVEPGPLPTGTGEALRCYSFLGVPEISLRWEGIFQGWQCWYFLAHSSLGHSVYSCTSWTTGGGVPSEVLWHRRAEVGQCPALQRDHGSSGPTTLEVLVWPLSRPQFLLLWEALLERSCKERGTEYGKRPSMGPDWP